MTELLSYPSTFIVILLQSLPITLAVFVTLVTDTPEKGAHRSAYYLGHCGHEIHIHVDFIAKLRCLNKSTC